MILSRVTLEKLDVVLDLKISTIVSVINDPQYNMDIFQESHEQECIHNIARHAVFILDAKY